MSIIWMDAIYAYKSDTNGGNAVRVAHGLGANSASTNGSFADDNFFYGMSGGAPYPIFKADMSTLSAVTLAPSTSFGLPFNCMAIRKDGLFWKTNESTQNIELRRLSDGSIVNQHIYSISVNSQCVVRNCDNSCVIFANVGDSKNFYEIPVSVNGIVGSAIVRSFPNGQVAGNSINGGCAQDDKYIYLLITMAGVRYYAAFNKITRVFDYWSNSSGPITPSVLNSAFGVHQVDDTYLYFLANSTRFWKVRKADFSYVADWVTPFSSNPNQFALTGQYQTACSTGLFTQSLNYGGGRRAVFI